MDRQASNCLPVHSWVDRCDCIEEEEDDDACITTSNSNEDGDHGPTGYSPEVTRRCGSLWLFWGYVGYSGVSEGIRGLCESLVSICRVILSQARSQNHMPPPKRGRGLHRMNLAERQSLRLPWDLVEGTAYS